MKRLMTLVLCIALAISSVTAVHAEKVGASANDNKIKALTELGLLGKYEPGADTTRAALKKSVDALYGTESYLRYLENRDMDSPVLYGQVLMVLCDLTGWTPFIGQLGYSKDDPAGYFSLAVRAGITNKKTAEFDAPISISKYAELLYSAVCDASLFKATYYSDGRADYTIDKDSHLLDTVLKLSYKEGILTGTGRLTLDGRNSERRGEEAALDGVWYKTGENVETRQYFGMKVGVFIDGDEQTVRAVLPKYNENDIVEVNSEDVKKNAAALNAVTYFTQSGKTKRITLDKRADFIYNGRLLQAYTADDLRLDDCTYRFIDNNNDSVYDVVIADKYENFIVQTVLQREKMIIDEKNNTYKLEDYLDDGGEIRKANGRLAELGDIGADSLVSYAKSKDGEYTDFIVSDERFSGKIDRVYENWKRIWASGTQYTALHSYYANRGAFDKVDAGDEAEIYLDFNGRIAAIKKIKQSVKAGYILSAKETSFGEPKFKILSETGEFEILTAASSVKLNGVKRSAAQLKEAAELYGKDGFIPQLVQYRASADGRILAIETAKDMKNNGTVDNEGFTLDFDAVNLNGNLRVLSVNGKKVLYAKYLLRADAKVFMIDTKEQAASYVMPATSMAVQAQVNARLYNVNGDYEPEYIVVTSSGSGIGEWVDKWLRTYVADQIVQEYDEETEEVRSKLIYYDGSGKEYSIYIRNEEIQPIWSNAMYPTKDDNPRSEEIRAARNNKYSQVKLKDIKRGTVFQFTESSKGMNSFAIQHMPEDDNKEIIFEGTNGIAGANYGTTKYMFNGSSIVSYGKVIKKVANGIIINNFATTNEMTAAAELGSTTFPNREWDRAIPMSSGDFVWFFDKSDGELYRGTAAEIVEGDMIFMQRQTSNVLTVIVYRD